MSIRDDSVLTPEAVAFIDEWRSSSTVVSAHTSGSTGAPKRIDLLKGDMLASAQATVEFFGLRKGSTLYLPLSPSYIAGKMQIVRAEVAGCRLVVMPPSMDLHSVEGALPERIDMLPIVPAQIKGLLGTPLSAVTRHVIIGGAPMSPVQEREVLAAPFTAWATYGMTETCSHVALRRVGEESYHGLPGYTFSTDFRGCLVIDHPSMSFRRLVTNDLVELHSDVSFRWLGPESYTH
ncbi:MAG: AMP-binding protein, partial [Duncaniella sp.]|nr:AMP-binding protein [Duncaniella sp.]